ncbi:hypothetical protein C8A05DRAFT_38300, partial [Staphylotrichum tortipilum]
MDTPLAQQAEAVRAAVTSVATCSPATSAMLKTLLLPRDDTTTTTDDEPSSRTAANTTTNPRSRANTLARAPSKRSKATATPTDNTGLPPREKAALATHVVNAALKALGEAAKPAPAPAPRPPTQDEELVKTATKNALRRTSSVPMTPLQPRSLNRQSTSPVAMRQHARSPSKSSSPTMASTNLLATVECARVALAALRQLPASGKVTLPDLQLESGMSALVGRLVVLNLPEQAIKELRILKKRLDGPAAAAEGKKAAKAAAAASEPKNASQVFTELLSFGAVKAAGPRLLLVATTQIQILRVLALTKKPSAVEAALPFLRHDQDSSPINLLLAAAKEDGADVAKVARQIETVAQCLLTLAPGVSSKDDAAAQESRLSISPASALELQALALEARLQWWALARHKGDAEKDVLVPLSRFLGAYIRRTSESPKSSYAVCADVFNRIDKQLQRHGHRAAKGSKRPFAGICQTLATLARDAGQVADATSWATRVRDTMDKDAESIAKTCSVAAQLLCLHLKQPAKYLTSDDLLKEVLVGIQGPLRGDTAELDELLANICAVRKAAMHYLLALASGGESVFHPPAPVKDQLESFILHCPRFCLRWLGKPPGAKGSTKDYLRYDQRRQLLTRYLQHVLDSAFVTIKTALEQSRLPWDLMDAVLSDCTSLLDYTGPTPPSGAGASSHVKISHFYYLQYNALRQTSTDPKDPAPLRALRRSVDAVKHRTPAEKDKAQLPLKLERLADLARSLGRADEAMSALQTIRTSLVDDGVLSSIAKALATQSPAVAWSANEKTTSLSRAILTISKMELVHLDWTVDLPSPERAAALEHRLRFTLLRDPPRETQPPLTLEHPLVDALLGIYTPPRHPVRRLRVLLSLLCSCLGDANRTPDILALANDAALLDGTSDLGEDAGLAGFVPHLRALHASLAAAAAGGYSDAAALEGAVRTWRGLVKQGGLEGVVDDVPALREHLASVGDFLRMKGREGLLASVMELEGEIARL